MNDGRLRDPSHPVVGAVDAVIDELQTENQRLQVENARLKAELSARIVYVPLDGGEPRYIQCERCTKLEQAP